MKTSIELQNESAAIMAELDRMLNEASIMQFEIEQKKELIEKLLNA